MTSTLGEGASPAALPPETHPRYALYKGSVGLRAGLGRSGGGVLPLLDSFGRPTRRVVAMSTKLFTVQHIKRNFEVLLN
jgi:hypothetical protein